MELILTIDVSLLPAKEVVGKTGKVTMLPFTGKAYGDYFTGETIGEGVDTQLVKNDKWLLSARYMLEGVDKAGQKCRVFIENNGDSLENCTPTIYTDSEELAFLETSPLKANVTGKEGGVLVQIYLV